MNGDAKIAKPGMTAVHRYGDTTKLAVRRRTSGPGGWRLHDRSGGLSDLALDSDMWVLLTPERIADLFDASTPDEVDEVLVCSHGVPVDQCPDMAVHHACPDPDWRAVRARLDREWDKVRAQRVLSEYDLGMLDGLEKALKVLPD